MRKSIKTLKTYGDVLVVLAAFTIIAGIVAAMILENIMPAIGCIIAAIPLFASNAAINVICYTANTVGEIKQGVLPAQPVATSNSTPAPVPTPTSTPATAKLIEGPFEQVTGTLRNGCTFEIAKDGMTITYSDGNIGSLTNNINGVYVLQYRGRTFEYQSPQDAAEALYYALTGK